MAVLNKYIFQFRRYNFNLPKVNNSLSQRTEISEHGLLYFSPQFFRYIASTDTYDIHLSPSLTLYPSPWLSERER